MRTSFARTAGGYSLWAAMFAIAPVGAQQAPSTRPGQALTRDALAKALISLGGSVDGVRLPAAGAFTFGDSTVASGAKVGGTIAVANGTLHVRGTVDGDVVTYQGDIIVHQGGEVSGNAVAVLGKVTMDGGRVNGDTRAIGGNLSAVDVAAVGRAPRGAVLGSLALAGGWLVVLAIIGIGVLVFASTNLDAVSETLQRDFGRAFLAGIAGQLALLPALALLLVALTLTILGILLIPFAIVAYMVAAAGLVTLGYLAIARITGRTLFGGSADPHDESERRAAALKAMLLGLVIVLSPWFLAALLAWSPTGSLVAHTMAFGVTWVACTAGLGAALMSRGGVRRLAAPATQRAMAASSWATPTPVSGVAAARRPTPATTPVLK